MVVKIRHFWKPSNKFQNLIFVLFLVSFWSSSFSSGTSLFSYLWGHYSLKSVRMSCMYTAHPATCLRHITSFQRLFPGTRWASKFIARTFKCDAVRSPKIYIFILLRKLYFPMRAKSERLVAFFWELNKMDHVNINVIVAENVFRLELFAPLFRDSWLQ